METGARRGMWTLPRYREWLDRKTDWVLPAELPSVQPPPRRRPTEPAAGEDVIVIRPEAGSVADILSQLEQGRAGRHRPTLRRVQRRALPPRSVDPARCPPYVRRPVLLPRDAYPMTTLRPGLAPLLALLIAVVRAGAQDVPARRARRRPRAQPRGDLARADGRGLEASPASSRGSARWEDAQRRRASETGKPILVCVNMDGEIASEHYAGVRYRQPEIATLYEPYVCVIASVYRHTPRDHDEQGRRILCPRFGSVTCGEHIAIEPELYEQVLRRAAHRAAPHRASSSTGRAETYDVFYAWDTDIGVHDAAQGRREPPAAEPPLARGDRSLRRARREPRRRSDRDDGRDGVPERRRGSCGARCSRRRSAAPTSRAGRPAAPGGVRPRPRAARASRAQALAQSDDRRRRRPDRRGARRAAGGRPSARR